MKKIIATSLCAAMIATSLPVAGAASTVPATPTRTKGQSVYVDTTRVYPTGYNIKDNNYFRLRDIGQLVGFGVDWDETTRTVVITSDRTTPVLTGLLDMAQTGSTAKLSPQRITVDGEEVSLTSYLIRGNNYVKLRDIAKEIHFGVEYDMTSKKVTIDPDGVYIDDDDVPVTPDAPTTPTTPTEPTTPPTPSTGEAIKVWNNTMNDFSDAMIDCNWNQSKYLEVAKKYGPAITGKANATTADVIAVLEAMTGAPVDAVSMDDKPVNQFWSKELRKAMGETVKDDSNNSSNGNEDMGNTNRPSTVTEATLRQWEQEMVERVNEERAKVGAPALEVDDNLMKWSQYWAEHIMTDFRHPDIDDLRDYSSTAGTSVDAIRSNGNITGVGNVNGLGYGPVTIAMNKFMNSEGHRRTLLNAEYTRVGIGFAVDANGAAYCCQSFDY
ncbi:hypothetical protein DXA92_16140 [Agathobaculum butyriciproducens]|nr:hypothetical protein DXA92_16140 [Agathobaculum butyriciproducens]RGC57860.1 hypothetical protein DXA94_03965 [Agathobaculum butyriciproducens]